MLSTVEAVPRGSRGTSAARAVEVLERGNALSPLVDTAVPIGACSPAVAVVVDDGSAVLVAEEPVTPDVGFVVAVGELIPPTPLSE